MKYNKQTKLENRLKYDNMTIEVKKKKIKHIEKNIKI